MTSDLDKTDLHSVAAIALKVLRNPFLWSALGALALTDRMVSLYAALTGVGLLFLLIASAWTLIAPVLMLVGWMLLALRLVQRWPGRSLAQSWLIYLMPQIGFAYGSSRWGNLGSMGVQDASFLECFMSPYQQWMAMTGLT